MGGGGGGRSGGCSERVSSGGSNSGGGGGRVGGGGVGGFASGVGSLPSLINSSFVGASFETSGNHNTIPQQADQRSERGSSIADGETEEEEEGDILVQPGSTFGLVEQLLGVPFEHDFTTTTYCHLLYIDASCALREGMGGHHGWAYFF